MSVITISRQYGSGGSDIAALVAGELGWQLLDNEFIDRVAALAELPREAVEEREERVPSLFDRVAKALAFSSGDLYTTGARPTTPTPELKDLADVTKRVIEEAVRDDDVVLVGRGAQACLANLEHSTHVLVVGSRASRVARIVERQGLSHDEAAAKVDEVDGHRRRYVMQHYGRAWEDPGNYDVCVNTTGVSFPKAAELVVAIARERETLGCPGITGSPRVAGSSPPREPQTRPRRPHPT